MVGLVLAAAFAGGLCMRALGLPPLVGFLLAGFALRAAGVEPEPWLHEVAHAGVLLLLFSVGLKLRIKSIASAEVLGGGVGHLIVFSLGLSALLLALTSLAGHTVALLACAFGFSSTVIAAKILEEKRELRAFHGRVAIGILVIQDLVAVALLGTIGSSGLNWWVLVMIPVLVVGARWLRRLIDWSGRGEMMVLAGLMLAMCVGGTVFPTAGLSGELGALLVGALVGAHPNSAQLSYRLWSLKEILLAGFFVSVGMAAAPSASTLLIALGFIALLPIKVFLFFLLLVNLKLRARSSFLAAVSLASYSEFGLIVAKPMADLGLLPEQWLTIMGLTIAYSFLIAAPLNRYAHPLFERWHDWLIGFERRERHPDDRPISLGGAEVVVFGMGRVGTGAYEYLSSRQARVVGLDSDPGKVERHIGVGRHVQYADAEDPDLWERLNLDGVRAVLLALPELEAKQFSVTHLRRRGYSGFIGATCVYEEESKTIRGAGGDMTYNYFDDAGKGFAKMCWDAFTAPERSA